LIVQFASATQAIPKLALELKVDAVFANHDDEPQSLERDTKVRGRWPKMAFISKLTKITVVFERSR
jgi:deoxyribodipyrimidine photo-lyase